MPDLSWLSQEAKQLHALFEQIFYGLALVLLLLGVVIEYFKLPLGGVPSFSHLAGRLLIAAILLASYPQVSNLIAEITDAVADQIGSLNSIHQVLTKYYDKLTQFQVSWTSLKDSVLMLISFVTFFLLYISVYIADAAITYAWVLLYVFSPLLIALYVLPSTSGVTKTLYRSLFEIGAWKIVWSVLATLLWSAALSQINQPQSHVNFITAVSFNLILAGSLLLTPFVVNALAGAGLASLAAQTAGIAAGAVAFSPGQHLTNFAQKKITGKGGGSPGSQEPPPSPQFHSKYGDEGETVEKRRAPSSPPVPQAIAMVRPEAAVAAAVVQKTSAPTHVPFQEAVARYQPPANRSDYPKQPVQRALFTESRKPPSSNPERRR